MFSYGDSDVFTHPPYGLLIIIMIHYLLFIIYLVIIYIYYLLSRILLIGCGIYLRAEFNPFAPKPPARIHVPSTAFDVISFKDGGQLNFHIYK